MIDNSDDTYNFCILFFFPDLRSNHFLPSHCKRVAETPTTLASQSLNTLKHVLHRYVMIEDSGDISSAIHNPFESGHDLGLRSNFKVDLSRSNYISFDASGREKDSVKIVLSFLSHSS